MDIYLFFGALKNISCKSTCMPRLSRCLNSAGLINNLKYTNTKDFWFWRYFTRGLIWHLSQSHIRSSICFSLIVISRSNLFLEPTSTKQGNNGGLWWGSNPQPPHYESDVQPTVPCRPYNLSTNSQWITPQFYLLTYH